MESAKYWDQTCNPVRGCRKKSPGCANCYALRIAKVRARHLVGPDGEWTGEVEQRPKQLEKLLRRSIPTIWLLPSMGDLFANGVDPRFVAAVFGAMAATQQHTYLVPTKRADEMLAWLRWATKEAPDAERGLCLWELDAAIDGRTFRSCQHTDRWPLPNVLLGCSVEGQPQAGRLTTLAEIAGMGWRTWVSAEPLLGPVDLRPAFTHLVGRHDGGQRHHPREEDTSGIGGRWVWGACFVATGGETGPGARPCDVSWIGSVVEQCQAAGVACHVKQTGAVTLQREVRPGEGAFAPDHEWPLGTTFGNRTNNPKLAGRQVVAKCPVRDDGSLGWPQPRHRNGANPSEWPQHIRVRDDILRSSR